MVSIWPAILVTVVVWGICLVVVLRLRGRIKGLEEDLQQSEHMVRYWKRFYDDRKED